MTLSLVFTDGQRRTTQRTPQRDHAEGIPQSGPDQLGEVRGGYAFGDQPQQWWNAFERFLVEELRFYQRLMDSCELLLREPSTDTNADEMVVIPDLCGVLGVHVDDQICGGRGANSISNVDIGGEFTGSVLEKKR